MTNDLLLALVLGLGGFTAVRPLKSEHAHPPRQKKKNVATRDDSLLDEKLGTERDMGDSHTFFYYQTTTSL